MSGLVGTEITRHPKTSICHAWESARLTVAVHCPGAILRKGIWRGMTPTPGHRFQKNQIGTSLKDIHTEVEPLTIFLNK